jgi:glycosyltransferase involved in cell wall biosynthesis
MSGRIAVVIPAWNIGRELEEAVVSVRQQQVPVRILIVDNASDEPIAAFSNAEVIRLKSRVSVGAARNAGLEHVDEEFVMFMDGDDVLLPGALAFLHQEISARPQVAIIAGSFLVWDPKTGRRAPARWPFEYCYRLNRCARLFSLVNCARNVLPTTGPTLIRTSAARRARGFANSDWAEDWAFGAVLAFVGVPVLSRRVCGLYRVDPGRVTLSDRKEKRFLPAWNGRRDVRRRLRTSSVVPLYVRAATPLLVLPHAYFTLVDVRVARQRIS